MCCQQCFQMVFPEPSLILLKSSSILSPKPKTPETKSSRSSMSNPNPNTFESTLDPTARHIPPKSTNPVSGSAAFKVSTPNSNTFEAKSGPHTLKHFTPKRKPYSVASRRRQRCRFRVSGSGLRVGSQVLGLRFKSWISSLGFQDFTSFGSRLSRFPVLGFGFRVSGLRGLSLRFKV